MLAALKNAVPDIAKVAGLAPGVVTRAAIVRDASKLKRVVDSAEKVAKAAKANKSLVKELVRKELTGEKDKLRNLLLSFNQHRRNLDPVNKQVQSYTITYTSYDGKAAVAARRLAVALRVLGVEGTGASAYRRRRKSWTVLKSPFKYKRAQETYEMLTYIHSVTFDADPLMARRLVAWVKKTLFGGVMIKIQKTQYWAPEAFYVNPYIKEQATLPKSKVDYSDSDITTEL